MPVKDFATELFQKEKRARKGFEHLLKKMDGAPRDGLCVGKIGFDTQLYMAKPPTLIKDIRDAQSEMGFSFVSGESNIFPRAFKIAQKLKQEYVSHVLLSTEDERVSIHTFVVAPWMSTRRVINMDADSVWFVYQGTGYCNTSLGHMKFGPGDFIYIPARICYQFRGNTDERDNIIIVGMESASGFEKPRPKATDNNDIPYDCGDIRLPYPRDIHQFDDRDNDRNLIAEDEYYVYVKRNRAWSRITYPISPFQCIAWKGTLYPFAIHESDLNFSYVTSKHPDPSNFATFIAKDISAVISVLGPRFVHSLPYNHLNQWEEFLFYAKKYESREGTAVGEGGDATLHPQGVWHGPQMKQLMNWKRPRSQNKIPFVDDLAIMFEASKPLLLCEAGQDILVPGYERSWIEGWEEYQELQKEKK